MSDGQKPGFYAGELHPGEMDDLEAARTTGLLEEIAMLRMTMRRTMAMARDLEKLDELLEVLKALSAASGRLASLVRAQVEVSGKRGSEMEALLERTLAEITAELGLDESQASR